MTIWNISLFNDTLCSFLLWRRCRFNTFCILSFNKVRGKEKKHLKEKRWYYYLYISQQWGLWDPLTMRKYLLQHKIHFLFKIFSYCVPNMLFKLGILSSAAHHLCAVFYTLFCWQYECMCDGCLKYKEMSSRLRAKWASRLIRVYMVSRSSPVGNRLFLLHLTAEYQSGRFTVGPFCMSRLLQLFVTPCQGSSTRSSAPTEARALGLAWKCVHDSGLSGMYVFVCSCMSTRLCVLACLFACVLEGQCQDAASSKLGLTAGDALG